MSTALEAMADFVADKLSDNIEEARLIPLDAVGQFAYVDTEGSAIYLITIQEARLVPALDQEHDA